MKKLLSNTNNRHKRHHPMPVLTSLGNLLIHNHYAPSIFRHLPLKEVLLLRETSRLWHDMPLYHMVLRCISPTKSITTQDDYKLKDELRLLRLFHHSYDNNLAGLKTQLRLLKKDNDFINAQKTYKSCYTSFATLIKNPDAISIQQELDLMTIHNSINTPCRRPLFLEMKAVDIMQDRPLERESFNGHIQQYIDTSLHTEKTNLFHYFNEIQESENQQRPLTKQATDLLTQHPLLILAKNENGDTLLHLATKYGYKNIVQALIAAGAYVNATTQDGSTPLHLAAFHGKTNIIKVLIQAGANMNAKDKEGDSPLHSAAWNGYSDTAQALITAGSDINAKNNCSTTPLHWATIFGHTRVAQVLRTAGSTE